MSENTEVHSSLIAQRGVRETAVFRACRELVLSYFSSYPSADSSPIIAALTAVKTQTNDLIVGSSQGLISGEVTNAGIHHAKASNDFQNKDAA